MTLMVTFSLIRKYDNNGEKSERLIERITKDNQLDILKEFLINPMLTSLLYKTFEYKEEISYKKLGFYSQVYEALYNDHDKTKGGPRILVNPMNNEIGLSGGGELQLRINGVKAEIDEIKAIRKKRLFARIIFRKIIIWNLNFFALVQRRRCPT